MNENLNSKIKILEPELKKLMHEINTRKEFKEIVCEVKKNFNAGTIEYIYQGKVVDERKMYPEENQKELIN